MTTRTFAVYESEGLFNLMVTASNPKKARVTKSYLQGYLSSKAAENDIVSFTAHLDAGKRLSTFVKNLGQKSSRNATHRQRRRGNYGCVSKAVKRMLRWKYNLYCKTSRQSDTVPMSRAAWDTLHADECTSERSKRAFCRDPRTSHLLLMRGLESPLDEDKAKTIDNAVQYMRERTKLLMTSIAAAKLHISKLRKAFFKNEIFSLLMKAKFVEEGEKEKEECTLQNTSKEQMSRLSVQSMMTLSVCLRLNQRSREEMVVIEGCLQQIQSAATFSEMQLSVADSLKTKSDFKIKNSMGSIVNDVYLESEKMVPAVTIRKWYNEFKEYGLFKEDRRGCYERRNFLDDYDYTRRFVLYLKNEKHLSVDQAKKNLMFILESSPPESDKGKKALSDLLPLSRSTVHRWMIKNGCKYTKASVCYYTDSHESDCSVRKDCSAANGRISRPYSPTFCRMHSRNCRRRHRIWLGQAKVRAKKTERFGSEVRGWRKIR